MRSVTQGGTGIGVNSPMEKGMQPVTLKDKAAINPPTMCFFLVFITDTFLQLKRTRVSRSRLKPFLFNQVDGTGVVNDWEVALMQVDTTAAILVVRGLARTCSATGAVIAGAGALRMTFKSRARSNCHNPSPTKTAEIRTRAVYSRNFLTTGEFNSVLRLYFFVIC